MIDIRDLTKKYGELYAVNRLTLHLEPGDVYGFIGPNGSGKTTTMRMLATLLNPSWGEASVCGYSIYTGSKEIRRAIGFMPDFFGVYDDMKVIEYLEFFAAAYRIQGPARRQKCEDVLERVDLVYKRDALVTSLSRGMTQRLGLARTLLHDPQVLLLDEPASGLDPRARINMRNQIKKLRNEKKTIMVSSHILPELADICNKIGIIERGQLLFNGDVAAAIKQVRGNFVFTVSVFRDRTEAAAKKLESYSEVESVKLDSANDLIEVKLKEENQDGSLIAIRLKEEGFRIKSFKERDKSICAISVLREQNEDAVKTLQSYDEVQSVKLDRINDLLEVKLKEGHEDGSFLPERLIQMGFRLKSFREKEVNLEDVFMEITKGITS